MAYLSPDGPVYQAGTLSGNPLAMAAGIATLDGHRVGLRTLRAARGEDRPARRRVWMTS